MADTSTDNKKPNAMMSMSSKGRLNLQTHEHLVLGYYNDMGRHKGNCTYGYGTKVHTGICTAEELKLPVTLEMAEATLTSRIRDAEGGVQRNVTYPLAQDQFDALVSMAFNAGISGIMPVIRIINKGDLPAAADKIDTYIYGTSKGKKVLLRGLISRRGAESRPFRLPPEGSQK